MRYCPASPIRCERDPARQEAIRQQRVDTLTLCDALVLVALPPDGRAVDADLIVVGKHDRNSARSSATGCCLALCSTRSVRRWPLPIRRKHRSTSCRPIGWTPRTIRYHPLSALVEREGAAGDAGMSEALDSRPPRTTRTSKPRSR
jgi:hypothetical protein